MLLQRGDKRTIYCLASVSEEVIVDFRQRGMIIIINQHGLCTPQGRKGSTVVD